MTNFLKLSTFATGLTIIGLLSYIEGLISSSPFVRMELVLLTYTLIYLLTTYLVRTENKLVLFSVVNVIFGILTLVFQTDISGNVLFGFAFNLALAIAFTNSFYVEVEKEESILSKEERRKLFYNNYKFE